MGDEVKISLNFNSDHEKYTFNEQRCKVTLSVEVPEFHVHKRTPVNIVAVIDRSGSMKGEKLEVVKKTLKFIIDRLHEDDRMSLVSYDTYSKVEFELMRMTEENKEKFQDCVFNLKEGDWTNLCAGLLEGIKQTYSSQPKADVRSVLLLTDGLPNRGTVSEQGILQQMEENGFIKIGGTVYTFGFGSDHNSELLRKISDHGSGVYYYIDHPDKIDESFADCLGDLFTEYFQQAFLEMNCCDAFKCSECHIQDVHERESEVHFSTAHHRCKISLGNLHQGDRRDVMVNIMLPAVEQSVEHVFKAKLSYFDIITRKNYISEERDFHIIRTKELQGQTADVNERVEMISCRNCTVESMQNAKLHASKDKYTDAQKVLGDGIATVEQSRTAKQAFCQHLIKDMKRCQEYVGSQEIYRRHGQFYLCSKMQAHSAQRSNFVDDQTYYQNRTKIKLRAMARKAPPNTVSCDMDTGVSATLNKAWSVDDLKDGPDVAESIESDNILSPFPEFIADNEKVWPARDLCGKTSEQQKKAGKRKYLTVKFLNEPFDWQYNSKPITTEVVLSMANEWYKTENGFWAFLLPKEPLGIYFQCERDALIRVEFIKTGVSCSKLGRDAMDVTNQKEATMKLNLSTGGDKYKKHVVVHEFGHALGLLHEHQNPDLWKKVGKYMDEERMKLSPYYHQLKELAGSTEAKFDECSVMLYPIGQWLKEEYSTEEKLRIAVGNKSMTKDVFDYLLGVLNSDHFDKPSYQDIHQFRKIYGDDKKRSIITSVSYHVAKPCTSVAVCYSTYNWEPITMTPRLDGNYVAIVNLPVGEHQYKFIVDDEWYHKPDEPAIMNCFGTYNNVLNITEKHIDDYYHMWRCSDHIYLGTKSSTRAPPILHTNFLK